LIGNIVLVPLDLSFHLDKSAHHLLGLVDEEDVQVRWVEIVLREQTAQHLLTPLRKVSQSLEFFVEDGGGEFGQLPVVVEYLFMYPQFLEPKHIQIIKSPRMEGFPGRQLAEDMVKLGQSVFELVLVLPLADGDLARILEEAGFVYQLVAALDLGKQLDGDVHSQRLNSRGDVRERGAECELTYLLKQGMQNFSGDSVPDGRVLVLDRHAFLNLHEYVVQEVLENAQYLLLGVEIILYGL
jgi:hypothetical protein